MNARLGKKLRLLCCLPPTILLYIVLHESGHCIVALACGAEILEFSILHAHITSSGGNFTDLSNLWFYANGTIFPLILGAAYATLYRTNRGSVYRAFSFFFTLIPVYSLLAWVFIPVLYLHGAAPPEDDCTLFLEIFSAYAQPWTVTVAAVILIVLDLILLARERILQNLIDDMRD